MPVLRIPNKGQWTNSNNGEYLGSVIQTFNGNLGRKQGKFSVSDRFYPYTVTADISTIGVATGFVYTANEFAVADTVYINGGTAFAVDSFANNPTGLSNSDIINWGNYSGTFPGLIVGVGADLSWRNGTTWVPNYWHGSGNLNQPNLVTTLGSTTAPTILLTFGNSPVLFIINANQVHSVGTPNSPTSTDVSYNRVVFPANLCAKWARVANNKIYIGLVNTNNLETSPSQVAEYDPIQELVNLIQVDQGATMGYVLDNVVYVVDGKGSIRSYNGQSFAETGDRFPSAYQEGSLFPVPHRNGVLVVEGKARFLISSNNPEMPSGIWIYDPDVGEPYLEYTMTAAHTNQNDFGSVQNAGDTFGALFLHSPSETMYAGAAVPLTATTASKGIFSNQVVSPTVAALTRGWFITPKIVSQDQESKFAKLLVRYDPNDYYNGSSSGTIVAKYRIANRTNSLAYITGTWVNGTSFTTTDSTTQIGWEVFITAGQGAGTLCHVTNVVDNSGTYTITIDETVSPTPSGTFQFTNDNWVKLPTDWGATDMTNQNGYAQYVVFDVPSDLGTDWIQFKVEIRGTWYVTGLQVGYERSLTLVK